MTDDKLKEVLRFIRDSAEGILQVMLKRDEAENKPTPIEKLDVSSATLNRLKGDGIKTIARLCEYSERDLLKIPQLGQKALKDVKKALKKRKLSPKGEQK